MNDSIKASGQAARAVLSTRLSSGASVKENKDKSSPPNEAVSSLVSGLNKAKDSVNKITEAATSQIEVIEQNQSAFRVKVEDVEEAIRLSSKLTFNISKDNEKAKFAHDLRTAAAKQLLE